MEKYDEEGLDIDLVEVWHKLLKGWKTVAIWTVAAFALGCIIAVSIPRRYTVVSKLAPELSNTAVTRLTSLSALTGMNANLMGSSDAVYPMVYPDILSSTPFLTELFDLKVHFTDRKEDVDTTLFSYISDYSKVPWWISVVSAPVKAADWVSGIIKGDSEEGSVDSLSTVDAFHLTKKQAAVVKSLSRNIVAEVDKKTLSVTTSVTMQDPVVAAEVSRAVNQNLKRYVTEYRTEKARHDLEYYQTLYDEAKEEYISAERKYSYFVDSHQGLVLQSSRSEQLKLQNEMNLKYQMYTSAAQQLQSGKAKVQQETPVFAEVIPPTVPQKPSKPSRKKIALAFAFLGVCCGAAVVLIKSRKKEEE